MSLSLVPVDRSLLYLQDSHRTHDISQETVDATLVAKRSDHAIWDLYGHDRIHHRVEARLGEMGLLGILQCGYLVLDNHLITALVEIWHRETHTFHFRVGEATVTLQDVEVIWGLKVDGLPVTGVDTLYRRSEWHEKYLHLLGFMPLDTEIVGAHLSMSAINDHCRARAIDDDSPEDEVVQYTRCIALLIIGGCLLPDSKGGSVKLLYLQFLEDLTRVHL